MNPILVAALITATATILSALITFLSNEKKWKRRVGRQTIATERKLPEAQIENIWRIPEENDLREKRMHDILQCTTTSFRLLARSGFSYLHHQGPNWIYTTRQESDQGGVHWLLENGTPMTVILENPYSENGKCRLRADNKSKAWRDLSWERIREINEKYENLTIHFTGVPILCSLFFTDTVVIYDPYNLSRMPNIETSKNHFLVLEISKPTHSIDHDYYTQMECHFDFILNDELTIPFEQFADQYKDNLG